MKIDGRAIAKEIRLELKKRVTELKKKGVTPRALIISIRPSDEINLFIAAKERAAKELGIEIEHKSYSKAPKFESFAKFLKKSTDRDDIHGIIVQRPMPASLATLTMLKYITPAKEIEAFIDASPHMPPLGRAVLSIVKWLLVQSGTLSQSTNPLYEPKDKEILQAHLKRLSIVLLGRGETGGRPIGKALSSIGVSYLNLNSQTPEPENFTSEADYLISAVGKKTIKPTGIKKDTVLISAGFRRVDEVWKGDFDENEIEDIASWYTPTPHGIGPVDVSCVFANLLDGIERNIEL